jgi:hypothetical protein
MSETLVLLMVRETDRLEQNEPAFTKLKRILISTILKHHKMAQNGESPPESAAAVVSASVKYTQLQSNYKVFTTLVEQVFARLQQDYDQGINVHDESYQLGTTVAEFEQIVATIYTCAEEVALLLNVATYNEEIITREKYKLSSLLAGHPLAPDLAPLLQ